MRNELENIERSEKYINHELSDSERIEFEKELKENPELQKLVENLKALEKAVRRKEIRSKVEKAASGGNGFWKYFGFGVVALVILGLVWVISNPNEAATNESENISQVESSMEHHSKTPGGLELWTEPDVQNFTFSSDDGATIEGKDGTLIIVPTNAFVDSSGQVVNGEVDFSLVEALSIEEMVLYKLKTVSDGSKLESGGMFYIDASIDGESVNVNPERPLYIEIPTFDKKEDMMAFEGEIDQSGDLNWTNPQPLKKYLVKVPLSDLDFLPEGFENEVHGNLPFLGHEDANSEFVDSLYYSLQRYSRGSAQPLQDKELVADTVENTPTISFQTRSNIAGDVLDGFQSAGRDLQVDFAQDQSESSSLDCGIDPSKIETIKGSKFEQTWIATKEFEERIEVLHKAPNGNELLDIYVGNLKSDLKKADQLVANAASAEWKEKFQAFADENLTNIKDANLYGERLSEFYQKKSEELSDYRQKLADELGKKNRKELESIYNEIIEKDQSYRRSIERNNPPSLSVATASNVYATQWANMGWGNIDRYYKLLDEENIETSIIVENLTENVEVTQWLNAINTYTSLVKNENSFRAVFPADEKYKNVKTHVFAIDMNDGSYLWAMEFYNPRSTSDVRLNLTSSSIEEVKRDLQNVSMNFGRLKKKEAWKKEQVRRAIERQRVRREKREAWLKERAEIIDRYSSEVTRQQVRLIVINKLRRIAFPCDGQIEIVEDDEERVSESRSIEITLEENVASPISNPETPPVYPGGGAALSDFISKNTKYPKEAQNNGIEGTVLVSFVIDKRGRVTNPQIVRGIGGGCDEEAIRVILMTSPWTPGRSQGRSVDVKYTIPVRFVIG